MKNLVKVIFAALLCSLTCAHAATGSLDVKLDKSGNKTEVECIAEPNATVVLMVVRSGASVKDNNQIVAVEYTTSDENGKAAFSFGMPEDNPEENNAEFDVYIQDGKEKFTKVETMSYAIPESRKAVAAALAGAESKEDVYEALSNAENEIVLSALGCDMNGFKEYDGEKIAELVFDEISKSASTDVEALVKIINDAIGFEGINEKDDISEGLAAYNGEFEGTKYADITDNDLKKHIVSYVSANKPYKNDEELAAAYAEANILYSLGKARVDGVEALLKKYAGTLGIEDEDEYKNYAALSNTYKTNVKFVEKAGGKPISSVESLLSILKDSYTKDSSGSSSGGTSGGSSGGGSSSSGGGKTTQVVGTVLPDKDKDEKLEQTTVKAEFTDLSSAEWAREAVEALAERGVVSGDSDGSFRPNDYITREEFVKMLVTATGKYQTGATYDFTDVKKDAWYYNYVASAVASGIVSGISDTEFGAGNRLTRQDMAVLCSRAVTDSEKLTPVRDDSDFGDKDEISEYARYAVSKLYTAGAVNGTDGNMFKPHDPATRAQCAVLIYNLFVK